MKSGFNRYYKGQKNNPYPVDDARYTAWKIEYVIAKAMDDPSFDIGDALEEYMAAGLKDYKKNDDMPLFMKALIFNRFTEYNGRIDIKEFKKFYEAMYP